MLRPLPAALGLLSVIVLAAACVEPLAAPGATDQPLTCSFEGSTRFFTVTGNAGDTNVTIRDFDPPSAIYSKELDLATVDLWGQTEQATYSFQIKGYQFDLKGIHPVIRKKLQEDGISLALTFQRPSLGRVDVESISGTINFIEATKGLVAASFEASLGAKSNTFTGCFRLNIDPSQYYTDSGQPTFDSGQPTSDSGQPTFDSGQ